MKLKIHVTFVKYRQEIRLKLKYMKRYGSEGPFVEPCIFRERSEIRL